MEIRQKEIDGVTLLELGGRFTATDNPGCLRDAVADVATRGARHVVLDLSDVHYIDSTRLGELISAHISLSKQGGRLVLACTPPRISELLVLAGLAGIFEHYPTVPLAVESLRSSRPQA